MTGGIYQIIVLAVAAFAVVRGFRKGFTGQICGVLGLAFGAVCSIIFSPEVAAILKSIVPNLTSFPFPPFIYSVVAASLIYSCVYAAFKAFTKILQKALRVFRVGMLDRLAGSAFCILKYMLALSIVYNIILCINPNSPLLNYSKADDGNMVQSVLLLAPGLLGCISADDLAHAMQLLDAKKISCNFHISPDVINYKTTGIADNKKQRC